MSDIKTATLEEEFEMTQIEKNNGDNLMFSGADKCKEWPQVGDEVIVYDIGFESEMTMIYRGKNKNNASIVEFENGNVILLGFEGKIKKPKTPEEELRDELDECISDFQCQYHEREDIEYDRLAEYILKKYNITKKPQ